MVRLETVLSSWKAVREDTAQAVEDFPAAEMDYRPTPELMTFRDTARHILDAGHVLTGVMLDGVDNMTVPDFREKMKQYRPQLPADLEGAALANELRGQLEARTAELAARPADFYQGEITRFDGQRVTRLEMLQFVKEHELTHRSQLFMYLRLKGIVPSTTRRRLAKAKA
ncbi:MAG: DinB family protein [Acidobacteriota bacterium]|nr:DinB family protein [Acidobacteriota bacterium]